ncbi:MAG TPA: proton-conducting transporter membrane subunit [Mycobacteriales bacterium]|nr:proton-conducting transporter membrane subunit [Mycobacteriales bacterium]
MTTAALLLAALCCLAGAALVDVIAGPRRPTLRVVPYVGVLAGGVLIAVAGFRADLGHGGTLDLGTTVGFGHGHLVADPLAGLFLALTGVVTSAIALVFIGWVGTAGAVPHRGLGAATALALASVVVILLADNAFVFLFAWETLSVAFYLLAGYRREARNAVRASMLTFGFSKSSGGLLLIAFSLLYANSGSFTFADWHGVTGAANSAAYALAIAGFAIKVGVVPAQVWMPTGYTAAPGPARALMSAVAANVGFYGMWRIFGILGAPPTWLVGVLLIAAALTALLGIAHAAVQADLQRLIAYSSVENGGLITAGYAIALAGAVAHLADLVALGLLASCLQMVAHAFAKSSLFLSSALLEQHAGTGRLDRLRGVGAELPWAGTSFTIGALTLAGLPLTLGFVSEWYLLESVMQLFRLHSQTLALSVAAAGALIALAIGFAGFTFVRLVALTILGGRGQHAASRSCAAPVAWLTRLGLALPAIGCIGVAAVSPWEIRLLNHGLAPLAPPRATAEALKAPWVLQPVYGGFSALSPSWLAVELPVLAVATLVIVTVFTRGSFLTVRRVPAWRSATGGVTGDARYTSYGFANATRHVLANVLMTRSTLTTLATGTAAAESEFPGPDLPDGERPNGALDASSVLLAIEGAEAPGATYSTDVVEIVEAYLYRPALGPLRRLVALAKRLQSGRLDAYVGYMLIVLIALLAVVVAMA